MKSVNSVTLIGYVGRTPEIRLTNGGLTVADFSLATHEKFRNGTDERTEWHRIVAFGKIAETVQEYVKQGSPLYIRGKLQNRESEKDGTRYKVAEIVVLDLGLLDKKEGQPNPKTNEVAGDLGNEAIPF